MRFLKSIVQFILSVYFLIAFFIMILLAFIVFQIQYFFFNTKYESHYKNFLFRGIGKLTHLIPFVFVEKHYYAEFSKNQPYIIIGNHNAALDIPIHASSCPKEVNMKFLSKHEASQVPLLGPIVKSLSILVDRGNVNSRKNTFKNVAIELEKGYSIFIYPEGTRNKTDQVLKKFYDGAFKMAIEHQIPILVSTLVGSKEVNSAIKFMSLFPGKVSAHWEKPIETEGLESKDIPLLKEKVREIMENRIKSKI